MKKLFLLMCVLAVGFAGARAQGIAFETGTVAEVMAKAAAQDKLVFVDVYTDWCGPCKKMAADVFLRDDVGEVFNRDFISYKIDAEKGEGPAFAEQYGVTGFPTMFFIKPSDGSVIHRMVGTRDAEGLLDEVRMIGKSAKFGGLDRMHADFEAGENDPAFLLEFYELLANDKRMRGAIALRYLKNLPDALLFDQDDETNMMRLEKMIEDVYVFDGDFFYRFADGLAAMKDAGVVISPEYNLGVIFAVLQKTGSFIERTIEAGDEPGFEELLRYKEHWPGGITRISDHDVELVYGRTLIFASPDFLRLEFCRANEREEEFRTMLPAYMDRLMAKYPKGTFKSDWFDTELMLQVLKANPGYEPLASHNLFKHMGRSVDMLTRYAEYYWHISPNDKATKSLVLKWGDYIASLNPYHTDGLGNLVPLMMRTGNKKEALGMIDHTLSLLEDMGQRESKRRHSIGNLRRLVANDKI